MSCNLKIIDTLTGQHIRAGNSLKSVTKDVDAFRVLNHEEYKDNLVLVDSPGFDDTTKSDKQTLETISNWLSKTYGCLISPRPKLVTLFVPADSRKESHCRGSFTCIESRIFVCLEQSTAICACLGSYVAINLRKTSSSSLRCGIRCATNQTP